MSAYRVELTVGPYAFTVTDADTAALPGVADGLTFGWKMRDSDLPGVVFIDPMVAKFRLVATSPTTYADLDYALPVAIKVWTHGRSGGTPEFAFYGRVSDMDADASSPGRVVYDLTATDYNADLGVEVGAATAWPEEHPLQRVTRVVAEAGHVFSQAINTELFGSVFPRSAGAANGLELIQKAVELVAFGQEGAPNRGYVVTPYADEGGLVTHTEGGYSGEYVLDIIPLAPLWNADATPPFAVHRVGTVVQVYAPDGSTQTLIDACHVTRAVDWYRDRTDAYTEALVTLNGTQQLVTSTYNVGKPVVRLTYESQVNSTALAYWIITDDQGWHPVGRWNLDSFVWRISADPAYATTPPPQLMPNHGVHGLPDYSRYAWITRPLTLAGIDPSANVGGVTVGNPDGDRVGTYTGQLVGAQLTVKGGEVVVEVAMNHNVPQVYERDQADPGTPLQIAADLLFIWDDFDPAPFTGATWDDVDPGDTWATYSLARRTP